MKKLLFLFLLTSGTLFAGNVITYTATAQLAEKDNQFSPGLFTTAFNVSITCLALVPPTLGRTCFRSVPADIPVYLPCGTGDAYAAS